MRTAHPWKHVRVVAAPDGRRWRVATRVYRRPARQPEQEGSYLARLRRTPPFGPALAALLSLGRLTLVPVLDAALGRRAWIEATSEQPRVTMVWRGTGRVPPAVAVDEIADALARGEDRPQPLSARWIGYDQGGIRLPPLRG